MGECLLISSLPGKASRKLVNIARLAEQFQHASSKSSLVNLISKYLVNVYMSSSNRNDSVYT